MTTSFITTAIPFVNARPHIGFAYELVLADILSRHRRLRGREVRFNTGTDDNSLKNVAAATREGLQPSELVDRNSRAFEALGPLLGVEPDDFVRTSRDPRHRVAVDKLWRACAASGDLYRRTWEGRYCAGCEAFVDDDVGVCAEHGIAPEVVREENWFFRLSRWRERVRDAIASGRVTIVGDAARAETLAFLDGEVRDLSVSRVATRSQGWGISVPGDPSQVIYVWFDALANYLTTLGFGGDEALVEKYWRGGGERVHVIGKGITRFHAVYWPAFLLSAGLPLPDRIFVHGYLTVDGEKISKSGRHVGVEPIVEQCGVDALRWYFARCCRTRADSDVSIDAILDAHDRDLADRIGNLAQRCIALAHRVCAGRVDAASDDASSRELVARTRALPSRIDDALDAFLVDDAAAAIIDVIDAANRHLEITAPWRVARTDPTAASRLLHAPIEALRVAAHELEPFVPGVARVIASRVGKSLIAGAPPIPRRKAASIPAA
jgi:methionyl-tRNA synthetase